MGDYDNNKNVLVGDQIEQIRALMQETVDKKFPPKADSMAPDFQRKDFSTAVSGALSSFKAASNSNYDDSIRMEQSAKKDFLAASEKANIGRQEATVLFNELKAKYNEITGGTLAPG